MDQETREYHQKIQKIREDINKGFKEDEESPFTPEEREHFTGLDFFPIDMKYRFLCEIQKHSELNSIINLETSKGDQREYILFGKIKLIINEVQTSLNVYKVIDEDYYFVPFKDLTTGKESYVGGRYVTLEKGGNEEYIVDFNLAYNPSCAYSKKYSCVLVPSGNILPFPIEAGVKTYH